MAGCDGHGEPRSWMVAGTSSSEDGGVLGFKGSDPASDRDCVPVDGIVSNDVLDRVSGVVDRIFSGEDAVFTGEGSTTGVLDRPTGRVGVGGGHSLVAVGDRGTPCLRCDGKSVPGEEPETIPAMAVVPATISAPPLVAEARLWIVACWLVAFLPFLPMLARTS